MKVNLKTHRLEGVQFVESPNADSRPEEMPVDLLVLHGISLPPGQFGGQGVEQLFTNRLDSNEHPYYAKVAALQVSAHLFIRRTGELIQFVPFNLRAWHAGESVFKGRSRCNDFSIGIELEGTDDSPYAEAQYEALNQVIQALQKAYPAIGSENIVGHCDIAPGRKTDPGEAFEWQKVMRGGY